MSDMYIEVESEINQKERGREEIKGGVLFDFYALFPSLPLYNPVALLGKVITRCRSVKTRIDTHHLHVVIHLLKDDVSKYQC